MNNKKTLLIAFLLVALAQVYIPVKMILDKEEILSLGTVYKFRTAPIDPNDPFRGKYIALNFQENTVEIKEGEAWAAGETVYVALLKDNGGFAKIEFISKEMPLNRSDVIKAKVRYVMEEGIRKLVIDYPFNRFYMEESKAYEAEKAYLQLQADTNKVTYALVSVKNGQAVLSDIQIDGTSIIGIVDNKQKEQSE